MTHHPSQQKFIDRFTKLRFRISFSAKESHSVGDLEVINDMKWTKRKIENWEGGIVPDRIDLSMANRLWIKYSLLGIREHNMWDYIDSCLKDNRKIEAIKTYREYMKCGLREAKNVIDAREMKNKGMI